MAQKVKKTLKLVQNDASKVSFNSRSVLQANKFDNTGTVEILKVNAKNQIEFLDNIVAPEATKPNNVVIKSQLDDIFNLEKLERQLKDESLELQIKTEISARAAADSVNLLEAKNYTDQKITDVINFAPTALDTLKELAEAIRNDPNSYANIAATFTPRTSQITLLQDKLNSLTTSIVSQKETFLVNSSILASNYIDLAEKVAESSLMVFVDRVPVHINEDYTLSTVDNKTRVTFINSGDNTFYLENDKIYAQYFSADFDYDIEFIKDKYIISAQDMALGYVDLSDEASDESLTAFLGRIALHEGEDYLLSYVNGVTRFTFINNPDNNFFAEGESLYIQYYSKTQ